MKRIVYGVIVGFLFAAAFAIKVTPSLAAGETPTLSTEQKQSIQILAQRIELAQLRAQAAESDYRAATTELTGLLKSLVKDGYTLNLQTLVYVKKEDTPKAPETKKGGPR